MRRSVASQCRLGEMRISGQKILRPAVQVGEVRAATAGDKNLLADAIGVLDDSHATAALACFSGTQQSCGASANHDRVEGQRHYSPPPRSRNSSTVFPSTPGNRSAYPN